MLTAFGKPKTNVKIKTTFVWKEVSEATRNEGVQFID
jgi:hypothetical protein